MADEQAHKVNKPYIRPVRKPLTKLGKFFKWVHNFSMFTRWFLYITPLTLIILVPILVGSLHEPKPSVAGVYLQWFAIWWEVIWLTLWAGKLAAKLIPVIIGPLFSVFTNSYKKWRDLFVAMEVAFSLFFWWLAIYISFIPIVQNNQTPNFGSNRQQWQTTMNRIILTVFIATCLNLIEKFLMQLVAIGFHQRQYEDRIVLNKFHIASLTKLYRYSRETERLIIDNDEAEDSLPPSGMRTPNQALASVGRVVQKTARDAVGKVTGELAGKRIEVSTSPRQMVLALLATTSGSQTLARRLYKSYQSEDAEKCDFIRREGMRDAFTEDEEADAAFAMFDKDFNGDVTCEEMEIACVEIGKERKSITSSLKDLDHAVSKLDDICMVIVGILVILIFIVLISRSFAGVLTSAGTTILGLSWLFSQVAQEFLASIVFVFVKHPFDVGDRVDVLMNNVVQSLIVKEISLMATEFRMLDGRIVQAPNNVLNQLFILNMRRTGGVAEAVPTTLRFGVTIEKIDALRQAMVDFVRSEPRDYKPDILSELTDIPNLLSVKFTLIFFHKQNWQNEGLRIGRRNKFMCALMTNVQRLGLSSSIYNGPGAQENTPMFLQYVAPPGLKAAGQGSSPSDGSPANDDPLDPSDIVPTEDEIPPSNTTAGTGGLHRRNRGRASSVSAHMQKVDYSLGATDFAQSNTNDFFEESQERGLQAVMEVAEEHEERLQEQRFARERQERKSSSRVRSPDTNRSQVQRSDTMMSTQSKRRNRFRLMPSRTMRPSRELDEEYRLDNFGRVQTGGSVDSRQSEVTRSFVGFDDSRNITAAFQQPQQSLAHPTDSAARFAEMMAIQESPEGNSSPEIRRAWSEAQDK